MSSKLITVLKVNFHLTQILVESFAGISLQFISTLFLQIQHIFIKSTYTLWPTNRPESSVGCEASAVWRNCCFICSYFTVLLLNNTSYCIILLGGLFYHLPVLKSTESTSGVLFQHVWAGPRWCTYQSRSDPLGQLLVQLMDLWVFQYQLTLILKLNLDRWKETFD